MQNLNRLRQGAFMPGCESSAATADPLRAHRQDVEGDGGGKVAQAQHLLQEELGHKVHGHAVCEQGDPRLHKCTQSSSSALLQVPLCSVLGHHSTCKQVKAETDSCNAGSLKCAYLNRQHDVGYCYSCLERAQRHIYLCCILRRIWSVWYTCVPWHHGVLSLALPTKHIDKLQMKPCATASCLAVACWTLVLYCTVNCRAQNQLV